MTTLRTNKGNKASEAVMDGVQSEARDRVAGAAQAAYHGPEHGGNGIEAFNHGRLLLGQRDFAGATAAFRRCAAGGDADVARMARAVLFSLGANVPPQVAHQPRGQVGARDDSDFAEPASALTSGAGGDAVGDSNGGDGYGRNVRKAAGWFRRPKLLLGAGVAIVAIGIAAAAEVTNDNTPHKLPRAPAVVPHAIKPAAPLTESVVHRAATTSKSKASAAAKSHTTKAAVIRATVAPVVRPTVQSSPSRAAAGSAPSGAIGILGASGATNTTPASSYPTTGQASSPSTPGQASSPSTPSGNPDSASNRPDIGTSAPARSTGSPGGSTRSSGGHGNQPADTNAGSAPSGTGATSANGIISSGGGG